MGCLQSSVRTQKGEIRDSGWQCSLFSERSPMMHPGISMVHLIPTAAFLWSPWHPGWKDTRSTHILGTHRPQLLSPPVSRLHRTHSKNSFFEEGQRLWTWELLSLLLSFAPLPLVQLVDRRNHWLQCFLNLDKANKWRKIHCMFSSPTGQIKRPFWILLSGGGFGIGKGKRFSRLSGVTEIMWFSWIRVCVSVCAFLRADFHNPMKSPEA